MTLFRHLILPTLLVATPLMAAPTAGFEDLDKLEARVIAAVGAGIGEPGGPQRPIDRRLRLASCPNAPMIAMSFTGAATLECEAIGWRIHVPLARTMIASPAAAAARVKDSIRIYSAMLKENQRMEIVF